MWSGWSIQGQAKLLSPLFATAAPSSSSHVFQSRIRTLVRSTFHCQQLRIDQTQIPAARRFNGMIVGRWQEGINRSMRR